MSNTFELNNVKVSFSTLMCKEETLHKKKWGKDLKILIPENSPEYEMLDSAIRDAIPKAKDLVNKAVNDAINQRNANKGEGEELEKPVVVRKPESPLKESTRLENTYEISFKFYYYSKKDDEEHDFDVQRELLFDHERNKSRKHQHAEHEWEKYKKKVEEHEKKRNKENQNNHGRNPYQQIALVSVSVFKK